MSVKKKLLIIMMLMSFIPLIVLSVVSVRYLSTKLEEETINQCEDLAENVNLQINGYIDKSFIAIKSIAANPTVQSFDLPNVKTYLLQVQKVYTENSFSLDDAKGNQVVRGDAIPLANIWERPFYQAALNGQDEVISGVVFSKNSNRFVVNIVTPVRNPSNNSVIGIMQGSITLTKISEFVTNLSKNGTVAYVIDSEGKILAHPDQTLVKDRTDMNDVDFVKQALANKKNGFVKLNDTNSGEKLVTYIYDDRTGWLICLETPYSIITEKTHSLLVIVGLVTLGALLCTGLLAFFIANSFSKPILKMQQIASKIAKGDLKQTIDIQSNDEIGLLASAFVAMVTNLKKLIGQVQENSQHLAASSEELTATTEQSATAVNQVATSITEVVQDTEKQSGILNVATNTVKKMSRDIHHAAGNAERVNANSMNAVNAAQDGGAFVESAIKKMVDIEHTVGNSAAAIEKLGDRSKEIGQIIDTISGIAGQTNLLALNAAIEAARAGEQGRGFAVVAEEVRKLAEQSQDAAKKIAVLIEKIQSETNLAVVSMQNGTEAVQSGTGVINMVGQSFTTIIQAIRDLAEQVSDTSRVIGDLDKDSQNVVESMQQINELTKHTTDEIQTVSAATEEQSASMEEIASASESLSQMAQKLQEAVSKFHI
jgi:methyl-accepting chemotaxis protein